MSGPEQLVVPGLVSVVVLNYKGADDSITCLRSLAELDWPAQRLELICVDNASGDGSLARITAACPHVRVVDSGANLGFAGGCNFGAGLARGEFVAFINNDARPDPRWLAEAVLVLERDRQIGAVASKVLDWDGRAVDFVDGSLTWYGMGYKREVEQLDEGAWDTAKDVLFGTGAAMLVRAEVFRAVGGFDERFFMFFEDVDFGWRLNVLGHRVRYVPTSVVFHKHHATISRYGSYRETYLLERNALLAMYKNYDDESLARTLAPAMALAVRRSLARTDTDARMLDLQVRPGGDEAETVQIAKTALAGALAIDYFIEQLPSLQRSREQIQRARRRSDRDLFPLFRQAIEPAYPFPSYLQAHEQLTEAFGIVEHFTRRSKVVVVTGEPLGERLAGPAIRAVEMSRLLAPEHDVTLVTLDRCDASATELGAGVASANGLVSGGFEVRAATARSGRDLRPILESADVVVFQGLLLSLHAWVRELPVVLVADVYDPFHLEVLEQERARPSAERAELTAQTVLALNVQLSRADFLLCASEKQRDFWLGQLAGQGRINPLTYDGDESLRGLIDIAPFGLPDAPATQQRHALRGTIPGIGADDLVVLWGGGVYNWFDPLTLVAAIDRVRREIPSVRLVFMGMKHPNPDVPEMRMAQQARTLAAELGLTGTHVFFNETWVPYAARADVLLDADIGVSCHYDHVETEFSFRTRILDYLWAGLPIVCTDGDSFGRLVRQERLGAAVPPEDVEALTEALLELLRDPRLRQETAERVRQVATRFTWSKALEPLARFLRNPRPASDAAWAHGGWRPGGGGARGIPERRKPFNLRQDVALGAHYLREEGLTGLTRRAGGRLRKVAKTRLDES